MLVRLAAGVSKRWHRLRYKDIFEKDASRDLFAEETARDVSWPHGALAALNIQFDDFSGKSLENGPYDFGGAVGQGINVVFERFLEEHPKARVTLFATPNADFKNKEGIYYGSMNGACDLSRAEYRPLVSWLNDLAPQVEVAAHGYAHIQRNVPFFLGAAEFEFTNEEESAAALRAALAIFETIGVPVAGFRPPAWGVGHNSGFGLVAALTRLPFRYVSLSSPLSGLNWDRKRVSNVYPSWYEGMLNLPQNISIGWEMERIMAAIDRVVAMGGLVTLMGHYNEQDRWMPDGIGERNMRKLSEILAYVDRVYPDQVWHATLREVADFWRTTYPQS